MAHPKLIAYVVENHDEALPVLYRAIGSKLLPMDSSVLVHFDSHPDLLIPRDLDASDVFDKHRLFEIVSIENWILPAVFAGHFSTVVWVKPPWAEQIPEGYYQFYVGKHKETSKLKVSSKLSYFIGEVLYSPEEMLCDKRSLSLYVINIASWHKLLKVPTEKQVPFIVRQNSQTQTVNTLLNTCLLCSNTGVCSCQNKQTRVNQKCGTYVNSEPPEKRMKTGNQVSMIGDMRTEKDELVETGNESIVKSSPSCNIDANTKEQYNFVDLTGDDDFESCSSEDNEEDILPELQSVVELQSNDDSIIIDEAKTSASYCHFLQSPEWLTLLSLLTKKPYVLDIDLDFFSTMDPFKSQFTTHQYSLLKSIYAFEKPVDDTDQSIHNCVERREIQLRELKECLSAVKSGDKIKLQDDDREVLLKDLIRALYQDPPSGITKVLPRAAPSTSKVNVGNPPEKSFKSTEISTENKEISQENSTQPRSSKGIGNVSENEDDDYLNNIVDDEIIEIDFEWLHEIGSGCDDTELPHHVSNEREIEELVCSVEDVVGTLPEPKLITVARSSEDDYCPKHQVETIQRLTLDMLKRLYPHSRVTLEYLIDTSP